MKRFISKNLGLLFHDLFKGTRIKNTCKFLSKSQYWDDHQMEQYRSKKLYLLFEFVINNNKFYQSKYSFLINKEFEIITLNDLTLLPILTKEELRDNILLSENINKRKLTKAKTGGTTGPPTVIYKDTDSRSFAWGSWYRWYIWMGINQGDPALTLWGSRTVLSKSYSNILYNKITSALENNLTINSFKINDNSIDSIIRKILRKKPVIIKGYLSAILQVADYLNYKKIAYSPKCISTTTETLLPPYREYIENTFNCKVYDQYASTEITGVAFECAEQNGLHISSEHVIVEILDENNNPVYNKKGRIVITDLDNKAMPFIRYEIGDMGIISTEKCKCGINLPLLKSIDGRVSDTIILNDGSKVHGVFFTDILHELKRNDHGKRISKFQAVQKEADSLIFKLESKEKVDKEYLSELKVALKKFVNNVEIEVMPELKKDKSGKFRYIISEL
jgi:phenylacetate-CoA ligase